MKTFVESQFEVTWVYVFQTKANSYEDICCASVWMLCMFMSFEQKGILMQISVVSQFEVMYVYEFQTNHNSYEDICWVSAWSYLSLPFPTKT